MIVFIEGRRVEIHEPTPVTLKKYGLALNDWKEIVSSQGYRCPICLRVLEKHTNIDHFHVQNYRYMKSDKKKLYVRGVTCWYCNKNMLPKGINVDNARRVVDYLTAFERRRPR
jgi:recombination endonuclease VII